MTPFCPCGKRGRFYRREYVEGGWEEGFRCKHCGRIRLFYPVDGSAHAATLETVRRAGIAFDATLSASQSAESREAS
jgi:hypothetical protein